MCGAHVKRDPLTLDFGFCWYAIMRRTVVLNSGNLNGFFFFSFYRAVASVDSTGSGMDVFVCETQAHHFIFSLLFASRFSKTCEAFLLFVH